MQGGNAESGLRSRSPEALYPRPARKSGVASHPSTVMGDGPTARRDPAVLWTQGRGPWFPFRDPMAWLAGTEASA